MGRRADYTLLVTSADGATILCDPIGTSDPGSNKPGHTSIDIKPRHNSAGAGSFTVAALPAIMAAVNTPDARVVVRRALEDGSGLVDVEMSGPIEQPDNGYSAESDGAEGYGTVTVNFADDIAILADRLVYPNPAQAATAQTVAKYTVTGVNVETALWDLVNLNAGPGALVARRTPGLTMAAKLGLYVGSNVTKSWTRDTILTDALRDIDKAAKLLAGAPRGVGFRVVQVGAGIQFQTYAPSDFSSKIVFSRAMGNVATLDYTRSAPTVTVALVGDATAGVGRVILELPNTPALTAGWRRREVFVDARGASNSTEMTTTGNTALTDGGPKTRAAVTAVETPQMRYGYDYGRGDLVSVQPYPGGPFVTATVLGANILVTPEKGEVINPVIGTDDDGINVDAKDAQIRALWRALGALQGAL
jgi:hypothetical protein